LDEAVSKLDLSALHRSELEATVVSQAKLLERFRNSIGNIALGIEDEGDRAYFGSTNDADDLRDIESNMLDSLNILECPWMHGRDLHAELASLRTAYRELLEAVEPLDCSDILGCAESCASGMPRWDHVSSKIRIARDALLTARNTGEGK
jgi:hypothetical protein